MHDFITDHPLRFAAGLLVVIALFWTLLVSLISLASGRRALASSHFWAQQPFPGQKWRFQSATMRRCASYNGCLTADADVMGLFLEIDAPVSPGTSRVVHFPARKSLSDANHGSPVFILIQNLFAAAQLDFHRFIWLRLLPSCRRTPVPSSQNPYPLYGPGRSSRDAGTSSFDRR